jgi:hypothetical protein
MTQSFNSQDRDHLEALRNNELQPSRGDIKPVEQFIDLETQLDTIDNDLRRAIVTIAAGMNAISFMSIGEITEMRNNIQVQIQKYGSNFAFGTTQKPKEVSFGSDSTFTLASGLKVFDCLVEEDKKSLYYAKKLRQTI